MLTKTLNIAQITNQQMANSKLANWQIANRLYRAIGYCVTGPYRAIGYKAIAERANCRGSNMHWVKDPANF